MRQGELQALAEFTPNKTWSEYKSQEDFMLAVWGSQRISFVAIYNAYETFAGGCLKAANPEFRPLKDKFDPAFEKAFGKLIFTDGAGKPTLF